jgi:hypothetical protein
MQANLRIEQGKAADEHCVCMAWCGWLQKQGQIAGWHSRWFKLRLPHPDLDGKWVGSARCAVLIYYSDGKGEVPLYIKDVRRERWHESGDGVAFSVGLIQPPADRGSELESQEKPSADFSAFLRWARGRRRVRLMAMSILEAVGFVISLHRVLRPESALPTSQEAVHFPARTLRKLC